MHTAMQKVTSQENIFLCNAEEMLGVQVKLNAAHKWKLTIVNENMPQHPIASARQARGRTNSAVKSTTFENRRFYEIAVEVRPPPWRVSRFRAVWGRRSRVLAGPAAKRTKIPRSVTTPMNFDELRRDPLSPHEIRKNTMKIR